LKSINPRRSLGELGERIAAEHLEKSGFRVLDRNVRTRYGEIDIVAQEGKTLVFVEVRTRRGNAFGTAEESVNARKQQKLVQLAEGYVQNAKLVFQDYRIDVVIVEFSASGALQRTELIKSAVEG
jgi:putative endonuclease